MVPSDEKLLALARKAVASLAGITDPVQAAAVRAGVDVVLNELLLRRSDGFFEAHRQAGSALLDEGARLLPAPGDPSLGAPPLDGATSELARLVAALSPLQESPAVADFLRRVV